MIYLFEDYSLDADCRELRRGPELIAVEPQVFDFLQYLISNRERVVSKDELIGAVWGGRIVSESAISSRITAVRHAVGDSGEAQRLIRTIARKGLRFVGVVREEQRSAKADLPTLPRRDQQNEAASLGELARSPVNRAAGFVGNADNSTELAQPHLQTLPARGLAMARLLLRRVSRKGSLSALAGGCALLATLILGATNRQQPAAPTSTATDQASGCYLSIPVTVLPFTASTKGRMSQSAMADRVNDQLRGYLSDISLLHVVAHDATRHVEMASSGSIRWSKSGPHYTVAGYLDEQDGKVRLRVDLIDAGNNVQAWSRTFEYTSGEFPSRQDDLARQLAYAVHVEAVGREGTHLPDRVEELSTSQLVAGGWAILIGGVWGQLRHGHAGKVFDEALRREPLCTAAMVGLAGTKLLRASNLIGDRDQQMAQAEALLRTAQLRGQTDFSTYFYLGILHNLQSNLPAALQAYDRALEINPSFAPAYAYRGRVLIRLGRYDEALQDIEYAYRLAGRVVAGWQLWQGIAQLQLGQDKAAGESFHRALAVLPDNPYLHAALAGFHALHGEWNDARQYVDKLRKRTPDRSDEWRLMEFDRGPNAQPLPGRLNDGLRLALAAEPESH